jgi:SNF2 family DNA or RNA helicase
MDVGSGKSLSALLSCESMEEKNKKGVKLKQQLEQTENIEDILDYKKYLKEGIIPYKHQLIAARLAVFNPSILLAMDVGSGKTLSALLSCESMEEKIKKVLIIVPNSLKYNWFNEVCKFTNQKAYVLNEKKKANNKFTLEESKYLIVNYEYFNSKSFSFDEKIKKYNIENPDVIIFDESHKLKNTKSNTTKNITKSFKNLDNCKKYLLSGTPMPNRLEELFVQLNFVSPKEFPSKNKFYTEYCNMRYDFNYGWVETDKPLDLDKLVDKLSTLMYRVKKKDVLKNLPEIQINKIYLELTPEQEKQYQLIESGMAKISWDNNQSFLSQKNNDESFTQSNDNFLTLATKLRMFNSVAKFEIIKEYIQNFNEIGDKVVIFDQYVKTLSELNEQFKTNSKLYYGGIDSFTKQSYVDEFQNKESLLKNLFITTGSGNFGITLTAASKLFMLNQSLIPSENEQCWARIHRIGQENPVSIFIFIFKNTIDEYVDDLLKDKLKVISKVIDNEEYVDNSNIENSIVKDLFNRFKQKYEN